MEFALRGTEVTIIGEPNIGFAQNNLVNSIAGNVDTEEGWEFTLSVFMTTIQKFNSIKMTRDGNIVYATLTSDMMPVGGRYEGQFVMTKGSQVSHSDVFNFWVENSINLNAVWTPIPTEFSQIEENMRIMNQNPPVPGDNGKWMVYNPETGEYEQSNADLPQDYSSLPIASASTLGGVKIGEGINVGEDGTISVENTGGGGEPTSGITQEEADARYLQLTGGTMSGDIDMGGGQIKGVRSIAAEGTTGNAGIQFASNGNFTNIVCGVSTSASFSANAVDFYNHSLDRVNSINMTSEATIEDAEYIGGNVEEASRTAIDFTTENAVGIWAQGTKQVNIDANGVNVNGNKITGVDSIVAEGSTVDNIMFEADGTIVGILCGGTRSVTFTANAIDAYEHQITRVGEPLNDTDAARKIDVDTVANTVNEIIDGTEVIPYLPEDGGTLSGPLNMGNNKITMGGTPTATTDVTNKGYVDGVVKVVSDEVDGILAGTTPITIPVATETHIGGIKPGVGTAVSGDGTLTIIVPVPTAEDNGKILVAENGTYVLKTLAEIQG